MYKTSVLTKSVLSILILSLGLFALPLTGVQAAGPTATGTPAAGQRADARLARAWAAEQRTFQRQGDLLTRAAGLISKVQGLIDKANAKGWDTSALQAALNAFQSAVQNALSAHNGGTSILSAHAGFDANGNVTDRVQALATVQALRQVLKDTRSAMDGTGKALRQALKDLRQAHKPAATPTSP